MDSKQAKELLLLHSYAHPDTDRPKLITGFLGSLRPYIGLNETNFHEVMQAIICLAPQIHTKDLIDREVMSALWAICELSRAWGLHPEGMLRRNNLISKQDIILLETWIDCISYAVFMLLGGCDLENALELYYNYNQDNKAE
jgi:hypothetical protein